MAPAGLSGKRLGSREQIWKHRKTVSIGRSGFAVHRLKLGADVAVAGHDGKLRTERLAFRLFGCANSGMQAMNQVLKQAKLIRRRKSSNEGFEFNDCSGRHVTPLVRSHRDAFRSGIAEKRTLFSFEAHGSKEQWPVGGVDAVRDCGPHAGGCALRWAVMLLGVPPPSASTTASFKVDRACSSRSLTRSEVCFGFTQ